MHLGKSAQKKRLETLEKDPLTRWRVTKRQWQHWRMYGKFVAAGERALRRTSTVEAPWTIVEGVDEAYRSLTVATAIRDAIREALATDAAPRPAQAQSARRTAQGGDRRCRHVADAQSAATPTILSSLDMSQEVSKKDFGERAGEAAGPAESPAAQGAGEGRLDDPGVRRAGTRPARAARSGGSPARSTRGRTRSSRSPRRPTKSAPSTTSGASGVTCRAPGGSRSSIAAGTGACWSSGSRASRRAGVEARLCRDQRVRGAARRPRHRPGEVLGPHLRRTSSCAASRSARRREYKQWKLTDEDWRNRAKWPDYERAVNEMVERTSTRAGAVDARRGQRQVLRAPQGAEDALRQPGGCHRALAGEVVTIGGETARARRQPRRRSTRSCVAECCVKRYRRPAR